MDGERGMAGHGTVEPPGTPGPAVLSASAVRFVVWRPRGASARGWSTTGSSCGQPSTTIRGSSRARLPTLAPRRHRFRTPSRCCRRPGLQAPSFRLAELWSPTPTSTNYFQCGLRCGVFLRPGGHRGSGTKGPPGLCDAANQLGQAHGRRGRSRRPCRPLAAGRCGTSGARFRFDAGRARGLFADHGRRVCPFHRFRLQADPGGGTRCRCHPGGDDSRARRREARPVAATVRQRLRSLLRKTGANAAQRTNRSTD